MLLIIFSYSIADQLATNKIVTTSSTSVNIQYEKDERYKYCLQDSILSLGSVGMLLGGIGIILEFKFYK